MACNNSLLISKSLFEGDFNKLVPTASIWMDSPLASINSKSSLLSFLIPCGLCNDLCKWEPYNIHSATWIMGLVLGASNIGPSHRPSSCSFAFKLPGSLVFISIKAWWMLRLLSLFINTNKYFLSTYKYFSYPTFTSICKKP